MVIDKIPKGKIVPPGSKSLSHRALICAAIAGSGRVSNAVENEDIAATLRCLSQLGAEFKWDEGNVIFSSPVKAPNEGSIMNCSESGSTIRFLIPLAAVFGKTVFFTGEGRLMDRPMDVYQNTLGCGISLEKEGNAFKLSGKLGSGIFKLPGDVSSQFVSGFLFALPLLQGDSVIEIISPLQSKAYVDLTLDTLESFGIKIVNENYERFIISGGQKYEGRDYEVEADYSGASFLLASAALGCDVQCGGLNPNSRQGDKAFLDILQSCGAQVKWLDDNTVAVDGCNMKAVSVDVSEIPDLVPPLAVIMCFCEGKSKITNAARLRIKESDRLTAVSMELNRIGAEIEEGPDWLKIKGIKKFKGGKCHAHNDHRIAMMAAVASIKSENAVEIDNPECVKKSYPEFWNDFLKIKRA